jgi:P27 family predicted phage terminase small subunit
MNESVDQGLINSVVFNQKLMDKVEDDLLAGEYMTNVRKEGDALYQISPLYTVYNTAFKNYVTALTKLAITPQERSKLGLSKIKSDDDDGF